MFLTSQDLSFKIYKMRLIVPAIEVCEEFEMGSS